MKNLKNFLFVGWCFCVSAANVLAISLENFSIDTLAEIVATRKEFRHVDIMGEKTFDAIEVEKLIDNATEVLKKDFKDQSGKSYLVKSVKQAMGGQIVCIGDLHGSMHSAVRDILRTGKFSNDLKLKNEKDIVVCTGDMVDRGGYEIETFAIFLEIKQKNPDKVFLLRGNHEEKNMNLHWGLKDELVNKYGEDNKIFDKANTLFSFLPSGLIVINEQNEKIVFAHGCLPMQQNKETKKYDIYPLELKAFINENRIGSFEIEEKGLNPLRWTDIKKNEQDTRSFDIDHRSFLYSYTDIKFVLSKNNIICIFRGHEHDPLGTKVVTILIIKKNTYYSLTNWKKVIIDPKEQENGIDLTQYKMITLSSATEQGIKDSLDAPFDSIVIIDMEKKRAYPLDVQLDDKQCKGKYLLIENNEKYDATKSLTTENNPYK